MNECLYAWLVQVSQVGSGLSWFLAKHEGLWVDEAESVDDNLALDRLDGIDDNGNGARRELLERLLGVDVDAGKPASKSGM